MTAQIRQFHASDERAVLSLANSYAAFEGETSPADLSAAAFFPEGFWVAEVEGEVVGYVYGYLRDDTPDSVLRTYSASKVAYVASMAVAPKYRRMGIASQLLERLIRGFRGLGVDLVLLDCPAVAGDARDLYDKLGFQARSYSLMMKLA